MFICACYIQSKTFMLWKEIWLQMTLVTSFITQFQLFIFKRISGAKWRYSNLAIFLVAFESCKCSALYFQTPFLYEMWQHSNRPLFKNATLNKRGQSGFNSIVCLKELTVVQHPFVPTFDYTKYLINQDGYSKEFCGQIGQIFFKNSKIELSGSVCFLFSTDDE